MKKIIVLLLCLITFQGLVKADQDTPIQVTQLPQTAQTFISKHFAKHKVAFAKKEAELVILGISYKVMFSNGESVEFDKNGAWKDVECKVNGVPTGILPASVHKYVSDTFQGAKIMEVDKDSNGKYEMKLSNGVELDFNKNWKVINIDR